MSRARKRSRRIEWLTSYARRRRRNSAFFAAAQWIPDQRNESAAAAFQIVAVNGGDAGRLRGTSNRGNPVRRRASLTGGFLKRTRIRVQLEKLEDARQLFFGRAAEIFVAQAVDTIGQR